MRQKTKGWILGVLWFFLTLYLLFALIDCQYVRPDIRLVEDPIGCQRSDGMVYLRLCAMNIGGKTAYGVMANISISEIGVYQSYLGTMPPCEAKRFEIDLPGVEWGAELEVSGTFKWE